MAVATKQSLKAAQLKELEEEQRRFEEQAAKKKAAEEAAEKKAAAKNKEADLPGYRPQETISKDEMYSMLGIQTKSNLGTSKQAVGDTIAKAAGAQGGIDKIENAKTRKAAEQARKNKEADLVGAQNSDYQKRLEQEKTEYLNIKEARDKKYALEQELLKAKAGAKEQSSNAGTAAVVASGRKGGNSVVDLETRERISGLEKEISDLGRDINLAERAQNKKHLYNSALKAEDFEEYSFEPEEETKPETIKPNRQNIERETETVKRFMTEDERAVYNYYLNKFGKEKAEKFFDSIREELNQRQAKAIFEGNEGKAINEYIQGAAAGLENAKEGFKGAAKMVLGEDEAQPTGTYDFLSEMAREDLGESGIKLPEALGGASLGQIGYDFVNTTANMLPSLVLGTLGGGAVGAAAIGTSAAGNAYNEAVGAGYDKEQAANYSVLVGASETALGYLLGGIEATGGKLGKAAITKLLGKIDNALLRTAVNVGGKMTSEFTEEYLQSILEPVFGNLALLQENEIDFLSSEAIYSGILGALSAGGIAVLGGSGTTAEIPPAFDGNIVTEEQRIIADKIAEIENSPISEAEKAVKMQEIANAVAETTKTPEVMAEAEKFAALHTEKQKQEQNKAVDIGKKLGVRVEFAEGINGNGIHTDDGRIIINPKSRNPVMQVLIHELTHDIETSGLYKDFSGRILEYAREARGIDLGRMEQMVIEDYRAAGIDLDENLADREIVAKFAEEYLFTDEATIERLCNADPTLFERIRYWISDMIVKLKGTEEQKFFLEAEKLYKKALATRGETAGAGAEQYLIREAENTGMFYVQADRQVITGDNPDVWKKQISGYINEVIRKNNDVAFPTSDGHILLLTGRSAYKLSDNHVASIEEKIRPLMSNEDFTLKGRAAVHIDELIQVAKFDRHKDDFGNSHNNDIGKDGFDYFNAFFRDFDGEYYLVKFSAGINGEEETTYSIGKIIKRRLPAGRGSSSDKETLKNGRKPSDTIIYTSYDKSQEVKTAIEVAFEKALKKDTENKKYSAGRSFDELAKAATQEEKKQHADEALKYFGRTYSWNETGYITLDGSRLDFSGRHEGGRGGYRSVDHRDIVDALGDEYSGGEYSGGMVRFMGEGNIRIMPESGGINLSVMPTRNQLLSLSDFISRNRGEVVLDIDDLNGNTISSTEYPKHTHANRVLADIVNYFENGVLPQGSESETAQWQYSTGRGFEELEAESRAEEQTKTPSMERAAPNLDVQYWTGIAEGIDMESGIWRMKDFARVLDGAAGGNKELRQRLYDLYEKPLNEAQGTYAKNYADKIESITKKFKELGIKAGSKESAAVQRIGEGVKEIDKNGNTTEYTLDDLKKEFPDSWKSIKAGADYCREIYDEFLNDLNAMYSEIYPATVEKANEQVSEYNARISLTADHIASYENVILELEKSKREKRQQLFKKKPDSLIYAELENQIANIDRKINIATRRIEILKNRKLTKEISRDTLLAQIENGEILKNKQIKPRKDYFRHFQELTDEFAEIADIFSNDQRIPPNLAGKSADTKPRTIWTSIAQSRGKNYYTEDAVSGLLRYTEIAEKLLVYDPLISHFRDVNSAIRAAGVMVDNEVKGKGTNAGQFAAWADDITNQLAGKTNKIDRIVSDNFGALGRSGIKAIEALNRRVKSNAILGNVRSALVQIGNLPNASLYIQNPKDWANGVISMLNDNVKNDPLIQEGRNRSKFMNRRYMGDTIDELTKEIQQNKILDKPKEFALWMLGAGDKLSAELIWHTAYTRALRNPDILSAESNKLRSYEDAVDYADDITRRSIGGRAEGDIPYFEESKITGLVAPFQIEVANTFNAFMEQGKKKNIAGLLAFEINVFLLNCVLEGITGDRPLGLDYIKVAWDIFNEATGDDKEEEEKEAWDIVTYGLGRILGETLSSMPFGTQIAGFLTGGDEQKAEKWFGDSDPTRYGTGNIGMGALADAVDYFVEGETPEEFYRLATEGGTVGEWAEPVLETVDTFAPLAMPWGGKQLSRSLRGIQQIAKGGAFGMDSEGNEYMKFPQGEDPESIVKTLLFGQYASDAGQRYIDSGFKDKLTAKQTEQIKEAAQFGISKDEFYETVLGLKPYKKEEEKQQALFENKILDSSEKSIVDWILFGDKNKPWELRDYSSKEAFYESGLEEKDRVLYDMGYSDAEIRKINAALKESQKKGESIENLADALDIEEKEAFEIYQKINKEWIEDESGLDEKEKARLLGAEKLYGMSTENYLTVLNYSKYGAQKNGDYSTAMEDVLPHIINATGWDEAKATEMYNRVVKYDYTEADIGEEQRKDLETSGKWYAVEEKGYFIARNAIKTAEGEKDQYGNTVSGSKKAAAIEEIARQLKIDEEEATIYYLAANGDLVLSASDLSTAQREDLEAAKKKGWTEKQFFDAVNIIKVSGASKKDEIIKALTNAGASYEMALGYYNLKQNNDYGKGFGG